MNNRLTKKEFDILLIKADLTKKEFADMVGLKYNSVVNWNTNKIPLWVKSWINNYIKLKNKEKVSNE